MKRPFLLGLAGVVGLGAVGAAVVASLTQQPDRAPESPGSAPASAGEAAAPPARPTSPSSAPAGPRYLALPAGEVERGLTATLRPCYGRFRVGPGPPAVLTLELEAGDGGGFAVVDARVASAGGASEGLVSCLRELLPGRRVEGGSFPAGERFLVQYVAEQEVVTAPQATPPAPSTSHPITRQRPSRRAGSR